MWEERDRRTETQRNSDRETHTNTERERETESQTETHTHRERCLEKRTTLITVEAGNEHMGVHYMFKNVHNKKSKKKVNGFF